MDKELKLEINWKRVSILILVVFLGFISGLGSYHYLYIKKIKIEERNKVQKELLKKQEIKKEINERKKKNEEDRLVSIFSDFEATSILIKELNGKEIFSKNKDLILPIASLTKIVNAIIALEYKATDPVIMTKRSLGSVGEYGILPYENFKLDVAIQYMLIGSINDISSAISFGYTDIVNNWTLFMAQMNTFARDNKMNSTLFFSENGLNINAYIMGSYSTSNDISKAVEYFWNNYNSLAQETSKKEATICSDKKCHKVENTNIILENYPEIKFSKTGYTKKAGGSIATVVEIKEKKYVIIILGSTKTERFNELEKAIKKIKQYVE